MDLRINLFSDESVKENKVDIFFKEKDEEINGLLDYLEKRNNLLGSLDGVQKILIPEQIYYFEAVDKKCFAYMEKEIYQVDLGLQELEELLQALGFQRVNKSVVLNLFKIDYIKAQVNMRVDAFLENGERIVINRSYKKLFGDRLMELRQGVKNR